MVATKSDSAQRARVRLDAHDRRPAPKDKRRVKVLIVDDHAVVRHGLHTFLRLDHEINVLGEAADGEEALELARRLRPDVVLMDLVMPGLGGVAATKSIRRELPDVQVLALTSVLENGIVVEAIRAGAIGYLLKSVDPDELRGAIKAAAAGQVQLSPEVAARLVREIRAPSGPEVLTKREVDVLIRIARGRSNKEIAAELRIGPQTVKGHISHILGKLRVHSRTQAALHAVRVGLVSPSELTRATED